MTGPDDLETRLSKALHKGTKQDRELCKCSHARGRHVIVVGDYGDGCDLCECGRFAPSRELRKLQGPERIKALCIDTESKFNDLKVFYSGQGKSSLALAAQLVVWNCEAIRLTLGFK